MIRISQSLRFYSPVQAGKLILLNSAEDAPVQFIDIKRLKIKGKLMTSSPLWRYSIKFCISSHFKIQTNFFKLFLLHHSEVNILSSSTCRLNIFPLFYFMKIFGIFDWESSASRNRKPIIVFSLSLWVLLEKIFTEILNFNIKKFCKISSYTQIARFSLYKVIPKR